MPTYLPTYIYPSACFCMIYCWYARVRRRRPRPSWDASRLWQHKWEPPFRGVCVRLLELHMHWMGKLRVSAMQQMGVFILTYRSFCVWSEKVLPTRTSSTVCRQSAPYERISRTDARKNGRAHRLFPSRQQSIAKLFQPSTSANRSLIAP